MIGPAPLCAICARAVWLEGGPTCSAFSAGIPAEILEGGFDHRQAFPGDKGIRFELETGREALLARWVFPPNREGKKYTARDLIIRPRPATRGMVRYIIGWGRGT